MGIFELGVKFWLLALGCYLVAGMFAAFRGVLSRKLAWEEILLCATNVQSHRVWLFMAVMRFLAIIGCRSSSDASH